MLLDVGNIIYVRDFSNRRLIISEKYVVHVPVLNNVVHGVVSAYHIITGVIAWSVTYKHNEADGLCKVYGNRKDVSIYNFKNYNRELQVMATKCAEYVLS